MKIIVKALVSAVLLSGVWGMQLAGRQEAVAQEKAKNPEEGKKGTTVGMLVGKGENFIEVKGDGEEKARKFVPQWKGGAPADGGGPDKAVLKIFRELKVGSRIEVKWVFEERLRALGVKVLRAPPADKKGDGNDKEVRKGTTAGVLVVKQDKFIEVRGDGEEKARKYWINPKADKLMATVREVPIGSRVSIEWIFTGHGPMAQSLEIIAKKRKE